MAGSSEAEWEAIEPLPWDDQKLGAFFVGYQFGLERAVEAISEHELGQVFGTRIAKLAVDYQLLVVREENYKRAVKVLAKAGVSIADSAIAITADGIKVRGHDLVERAGAAA